MTDAEKVVKALRERSAKLAKYHGDPEAGEDDAALADFVDKHETFVAEYDALARIIERDFPDVSRYLLHSDRAECDAALARLAEVLS